MDFNTESQMKIVSRTNPRLKIERGAPNPIMNLSWVNYNESSATVSNLIHNCTGKTFKTRPHESTRGIDLACDYRLKL